MRSHALFGKVMSAWQKCRAITEVCMFTVMIAAAVALTSARALTPVAYQHEVERQTFAMLRPVDQARVLAHASPRFATPHVGRNELSALNDRQRAFLASLEARLQDGRQVPALCVAPDSSPAVAAAFEQFMARLDHRRDRFQQAGRWDQTASQPGPLGQGDITTLTYSFVPDGTIVPDYTDTAPSALFAFLNNIYGTPATWQAIYAQVFQRWADLCGTSYVLESSDDGAPIDDNAVPTSGILGVRGDCRMAGAPIDGNSGILAFNYYPAPDAGGDMVIDTDDSFYANTSGASIRLRNVLAHEHGHGLGMAHCCPRTNSKLMEPFISTIFDGPQIDDILNGQRHYGDNLEPNDTAAAPTAVASLASPVTYNPVSIDGAADVDWYRISPPSVGITTIEVVPLGGTYGDNSQDSLCTSQGYTNYSANNQLFVEVFNAAGTTLQVSRIAPAGSTIRLRVPTDPGAIRQVRVRSGASDVIQAYAVTFSHAAGQAIVIDLPSGLPANLDTTTTTTFTVAIQSTSPLTGTPTVSYSLTGPGSLFSTFPLVPLGGGLYQATLPHSPLCAAGRFRITASSAPTGEVTFPGPAATDSLLVPFGTPTNSFTDDFESDLSWTYTAPGDTASSGFWLRGDPNASSGQPENAFAGANCAFTGQAAPTDGSGVNDVDNGFTTLISPAFSLVSRTSPVIRYARWFCNSAGSNPATRNFRIDISSDGGSSWSSLETVGPGGPGIWGGWINASVPVPPAVALTANMRVRFVADDTGAGAVYEAAIDDFSAAGVSCALGLLSDANNTGTITVQDIFDFLAQWFAGTIGADATGDGGITVQDIFTFLAAWFANA